MLGGLLVLLGCQLLGAAFVDWLGLPLPGAVLGMVALFCILAWRRRVPADVDATASMLLRHLGLLFVPAGVGVMRQIQPLSENALGLALTLGGSTLAALLVTAWVMQRLAGRESPSGSREKL
jgi:putative effector of murein hydrolase LrgA (UPF0299 family)